MIKVETYTLAALKRKFENRDFAIPEIQRQFVWTGQKICKLMDSVYRNYPIGIALVWRSTFSQALNIRKNNKTIIDPFNKKSKKPELIIDGQQRLSTLFGVLFGIGPKPEANSLIDFKNLYFDCRKDAEKRFVFSKKLNEDSLGYIRLTTLLNTRPSVLKAKMKLKVWESREALKCYKSFHDYEFYSLVFQDMKYDDVREIFIRINSAGMTVSRADTLFAKASNVNLRDHMLDTRRGLKHNYFNISIDALQNTLGLAYGATRIGNQALELFLKKAIKENDQTIGFTKQWKKLQYGYEHAVDFLVNTLKVVNPVLLPSQNIYSMLAYFFFLNQSRAKPGQIREIKKWFWHTACGDRYSGAGFNKNIPDDIKFFQRLAKSPTAKYIVSEKIDTRKFLASNYKNSRASSTSAYFILLRHKNPRYLANGEEMQLDETSAIANRKDRHHIFPYALLRRTGVNLKWINSICNICYLESNENQSISDTHPRIYLEEYKRRKFFGTVMKGHLIPYDKTSAVWKHGSQKDFVEFLNIRGRKIIAEIEVYAGTKIFDDFDEIRKA